MLLLVHLLLLVVGAAMAQSTLEDGFQSVRFSSNVNTDLYRRPNNGLNYLHSGSVQVSSKQKFEDAIHALIKAAIDIVYKKQPKNSKLTSLSNGVRANNRNTWNAKLTTTDQTYRGYPAKNSRKPAWLRNRFRNKSFRTYSAPNSNNGKSLWQNKSFRTGSRQKSLKPKHAYFVTNGRTYSAPKYNNGKSRWQSKSFRTGSRQKSWKPKYDMTTGQSSNKGKSAFLDKNFETGSAHSLRTGKYVMIGDHIRTITGDSSTNENAWKSFDTGSSKELDNAKYVLIGDDIRIYSGENLNAGKSTERLQKASVNKNGKTGLAPMSKSKNVKYVLIGDDIRTYAGKNYVRN